MDVDDFTERRRLRARRSAATGLDPVFVRYLEKLGRPSKLFRIDRVGPIAWRCEVHFGGAIHRTTLATSRSHMTEWQAQFTREVAELLADGWTDTPASL